MHSLFTIFLFTTQLASSGPIRRSDSKSTTHNIVVDPSRLTDLTVYTNKNFKGVYQSFSAVWPFECLRLDSSVYKKVTSYRVSSGCCSFFDKDNCVGVCTNIPTLGDTDCKQQGRCLFQANGREDYFLRGRDNDATASIMCNIDCTRTYTWSDVAIDEAYRTDTS